MYISNKIFSDKVLELNLLSFTVDYLQPRPDTSSVTTRVVYGITHLVPEQSD